MTSAIAYAFTLGLVGLLNPCGFPLLPAYLTLFLGGGEAMSAERVGRGLKAGGCLTLGFVLVFGILGLAASAVLAAITAVVPWLMCAVAVALAAVGVAAALGRAPQLHLPAPRFAAGARSLAVVGFGAAYAVGSLSCSLPLFLAGVSGAFTTAAPGAGVAAFLAYAVGMGLFATAASITTAVFGAGAVRGLRRAAPVLARIAGIVCAAAGLYLLAYWLRELVAPGAHVPLIVDAQTVQTAVSSWLSAAAVPAAAALGAIVVAAFVALALSTRKEPAP
jgi:cytochrome c biogenesis protein CcdA